MTGLEVPAAPEAASGPEPETGQPESQSPGPVPWEDPERPRLPGFFQTLGEILRRPAAFFALPARGGPAEPLAFGLIMGTAGSLLALFWWVLLLVAAGPGVKSVLAMAKLADLGWGPVALVMALTPLTVLTKLVLGSLCLWGAAALLGTRVEWVVVWRILCYATAAMVLAVAPFLGAPLAGLLGLFLIHQGLQGSLGMSFGRALGALAVFLILQILTWMVLLGGFLALLALLGLLFLG